MKVAWELKQPVMAIPKYDEIVLPLVKLPSDRNDHQPCGLASKKIIASLVDKAEPHKIWRTTSI
jgi:hypothetical protein